ncbi:N-acetylmuramoyl-L-alanine amidase CwlD [Clostridium sp. D2Q-11]|uniref:N-acetylmuramoyl-L-alanine amidase CwlD n=1 Tax=Anaeromonas frigoriresistens TaxID=2683708 RepID=A0A942UVR3_9FIRM|nr:N-acetylmuramoyl-L-alanine amidase CwlD [Anaeromonas frigoriresistens]MBS4537316.1 N-acetylmuramoyl-L-alanine amidase CwlD [Anaeromonas frigoriresistens]
MREINIKKRTILLIPIVILSVFLYFYQEEETLETFSNPIMNKIVILDAGHGGFDPGAIGSQENKEDDINLEITLKLRRLIEQGGGIVVLTREIDEGLDSEESKTYRQRKNEDLRNRRILINGSEPDVLISIHLNSFPQSQYYGAQTFYKKGSEESKMIAKSIQEELRRVLDKNNDRQPQSRDSIYLIREAQCPSVLVECGFLSNNREEQLLNDPEYQQKIAWSIYIGLIKSFEKDIPKS